MCNTHKNVKKLLWWVHIDLFHILSIKLVKRFPYMAKARTQLNHFRCYGIRFGFDSYSIHFYHCRCEALLYRFIIIQYSVSSAYGPSTCPSICQMCSLEAIEVFSAQCKVKRRQLGDRKIESTLHETCT